jgi:hypothetical protein
VFADGSAVAINGLPSLSGVIGHGRCASCLAGMQNDGHSLRNHHIAGRGVRFMDLSQLLNIVVSPNVLVKPGLVHVRRVRPPGEESSGDSVDREPSVRSACSTP